MASALWPAPNLSAGGLPPAGGEKIRFTGHCSERDVAGLVQASGDDRAVVIGVGGGALLDSAKVLARRLGVPLVAIPTIAATCAAWTPLSVWYSDAGQALNFEIFDDANFLVLVEPRIILNARRSTCWRALATP